MEPRLLALKALLAELKVPTAIGTIGERKRIQKAVYLAQRSGVDLGYRFGWYVRGPYSPPLADTYYALADALAAETEPRETPQLHPMLKERLVQLPSVLAPPRGVALAPEDWLELLASWDYLLSVSGLDDNQATLRLEHEKPELAQHIDAARTARVQAGLG